MIVSVTFSVILMDKNSSLFQFILKIGENIFYLCKESEYFNMLVL